MSCEWRSRGCRKSVKRWHMRWTWTWIRGCHSGRQTRSFTKIFTLDSRASFFPRRHDLLHPVSSVDCSLLTVVSHSGIFRIYWHFRSDMSTYSSKPVDGSSYMRGKWTISPPWSAPLSAALWFDIYIYICTFILCFVDRASQYNRVEKNHLDAQLILSIFRQPLCVSRVSRPNIRS